MSIFGNIYREMNEEAAALAAAAPEAPAPVETAPVAEAPVVEAPAALADAPVAEPVVEASAPEQYVQPDMVAAGLYDNLERDHYRAKTALEQLTARNAQLEQQIAQSLANQNPAAAAQANATATSQADWFQQLVDSGAEIPPELLSGIQGMQQALDAQQATIAQNSAYIVAQQKAQANAAYDQTFAGLKAACPGVPEKQIEAMLAQGFKPRQVEGWYAQSRTWHAPAAPVAAAPAAPRVVANRVPQLDAPVTPSRLPDNGAGITRAEWRAWGENELASADRTRH